MPCLLPLPPVRRQRPEQSCSSTGGFGHSFSSRRIFPSATRLATDELLRVLRETDDRDLRRQALFWLAESDDPRALERITAILAR